MSEGDKTNAKEFFFKYFLAMESVRTDKEKALLSPGIRSNIDCIKVTGLGQIGEEPSLGIAMV